MKNGLEDLIRYFKTVPYGEQSIKNLVRYALYYTKVINEGEFTIESIENLIERMHVFLEKDEIKKLLYESVKDKTNITTFDFRRIFKFLLLKEELASYYRKILHIGDKEPIGKSTISL